MKKKQGSPRFGLSTFKTRWTISALVICTVLTGLYLASERSESGKVFSQQNVANKSRQKAKKYRATRNLIVDEATGEVRMPSEAELEKLLSTLSTLANTSTEGLQEYQLEGGGYGMDLQGRFQGVFLARPKADGSMEVKCVFTFEEGMEFLGIVEDTTGTSGR